jgi:hypothetical protein
MNRPLSASTANSPPGPGRTVQHTLCKLERKLLLVADAVKQQLNVVVHIVPLSGNEGRRSSDNVNPPHPHRSLVKRLAPEGD